MARADVLRMARGLSAPYRGSWLFSTEGLERFAALVAAHEREECCKIVYGMAGSDNVAERTAAAIRARAVNG